MQKLYVLFDVTKLAASYNVVPHCVCLRDHALKRDPNLELTTHCKIIKFLILVVTLPLTFQNAVQRFVKQMPRRITLPVNAPVQGQMSTRAKSANVSHHGTQ